MESAEKWTGVIRAGSFINWLQEAIRKQEKLQVGREDPCYFAQKGF